MKRFSERLEEIFSAIAFAEAGVHDVAVEIMKGGTPPSGGSPEIADDVKNAKTVFAKTAGEAGGEPELGI